MQDSWWLSPHVFPQWLTAVRLPWRLTVLRAACGSSPLTFVVLTAAVEVTPEDTSAASVRGDSPARTAMRVSPIPIPVSLDSTPPRLFNIASLTLYSQTSTTVKVVPAVTAVLALIKSTRTSASVLMAGRDTTVRAVSTFHLWISLHAVKNTSNFSNYINRSNIVFPKQTLTTAAWTPVGIEGCAVIWSMTSTASVKTAGRERPVTHVSPASSFAYQYKWW